MGAQGVDFVVSVNTGTGETPIWTKIAGQRGGKLNRSSDTIDTTTKDSEGWKEADYGLKEWSIDADGLLTEDDTGYQKLEECFMSGTKVKIQLQTAAENKYSGMALITDFPIDAPYNDDATYSVKFQGNGALSKE
jgi:TP901-1 family phage major tail protein